MPAKNLYRIDKEKTYSHIYNKGVENRIIFNDAQDFEAFQNFLKDYLTPRRDSESAKKVFTVNGRNFRGIPHQPKNYFNKVELIAYSLMPNHFHLLLHQKIRGSLESFIRSLCTRYSMYFNKKYKRTGSLFGGPYKSVQIKDISQLSPLTHYIHHGTNVNSSYPEYSGKRKTSWVNTNIVLSLKKAVNYKDRQLIDEMTFEENEAKNLEGRVFASNVASFPRQVTAESAETVDKHPDLVSRPLIRLPHFLLVSGTLFLLLLTLGINNIKVASVRESNLPITLGVSEEEKVITEEIKPKTTVVIKISDGSESVNIREKPTTKSEIVREVNDGDTFEYISKEDDWYQIKLDGENNAFVSERYASIEGEGL